MHVKYEVSISLLVEKLGQRQKASKFSSGGIPVSCNCKKNQTEHIKPIFMTGKLSPVRFSLPGVGNKILSWEVDRGADSDCRSRVNVGPPWQI